MFAKLMRKLGYVKLRDASEVQKENEQLKQLISSNTSIINDLNNTIKSKENIINDLTDKFNELNKLKIQYENKFIDYEKSISEHLKNIENLKIKLQSVMSELNEYKSVYPPPVKKKTYAIIFKQQGLPTNIQFAVNVGGTMYYSKLDEDSITIYLQEGEYDYIIMPIRGYKIEPEKGHLAVNNNHIVLINFKAL